MKAHVMEEHLTGSVPAGASLQLAFRPKELIQLVDAWETTGALVLATVIAGRRNVFEAGRYRTYMPIILNVGEMILVTVQNPTKDDWEAHVVLSAIAVTERSALALQPESDLRERFAMASGLSPSSAAVEQIEARIAALVNDAESIYGQQLADAHARARAAEYLLERETALREDAASENTALRNELRGEDQRTGKQLRVIRLLSDQLVRAGITPRLDGFGR